MHMAFLKSQLRPESDIATIPVLMNNDEKILKALETIQADVKDVKQGQAQTNKRLNTLEDGQTHLKTAVEALKAGQDDIRDKMATEAGVMDLGAKVDRITRNHERRIEELEERAGLPNPTKN